MKFLNLALVGLWTSVATAKKSDKKKEVVKCPEFDFSFIPFRQHAYPIVDYKPYLIGLLKYPHDFVPTPLQAHTTGRNAFDTPLQDIPNVGITDIVGIYDKTVTESKDKFGKVTTTTTYSRRGGGEFYTLVDEGYGTSDNSDDFPLHYHRIKFNKDFVYNHGGTQFNIWDDVEHLETILIKDPDKLIGWKSEWDGHFLDIQVEYAAPANWQEDWKPWRVLTGRDLSPEGMATTTDDCGVIVEKWGPSLFSLNPLTGDVKSPLIAFPNIYANFSSKVVIYDDLLTTRSDKIHCYLHEVVANECGIVDQKRVDENGFYEYVKNADGKKEKVFFTKYLSICPDCGPVGLVELFPSKLMITIFAATLPGEPGPRIYAINPGDCTKDCPPFVQEFVGFYKFSLGADQVAAIASLVNSDTRIVVHEHTAGFPASKTFPYAMPADKLCILNLEPFQVQADLVLSEKICVLNYLYIPDPYDTTQSGTGFYPLSQDTVAGIEVINDWCVLIGTDTGYPLENNDYGLNLEVDSVPFYTESVLDTRFLYVCFFEPIFNIGYPFPDLFDTIHP